MRGAIPRRQIHLDFHTSEHIPDIGIDFDPDRFARTLVEARVDSVVLFAKCHHGWSYYDTQVGARHPNLPFDLLKAQVEACQAAGIRTPIYLSVGWDERAAHREPGWRRILPDGTFHMMMGQNLKAAWSYLCMNSPYLDYIVAQTEEIVRAFPQADGIWFDIIREEPCCCSHCKDGMTAAGLDWLSDADRKVYAHTVLQTYLARTAAAARSARPDMPVFHNTGMVPRGRREFYDTFSHVEIEALPTGGWGYDHFPLSARYIDPMGLPMMGVTGRFHIIWGELGGFKHPNALRAEIGTMIANGARICVGDHLDPRGTLDADVYRMIGAVYAEAAAKEPFVDGARPVADVALLSSIAVREPGAIRREARHIAEDEGALRILQQGHILFDVVDADSDLSAYKLVILPDRVRLGAALAEKLNAYVEAGGSLLLTGESGLLGETGDFAFELGATFEGRSPFSPTYVRPEAPLRPDFVDGPFLMFSKSFRVKPDGATVLGEIYEPYFNRSPRAFNGHIFAPPRPEPSPWPSGLRHGRITYLAHPVFGLYHQYGHAMVKQYVLKTIAAILGRARRLETDLPSTAAVTLRRRGDAELLQIVYAPRELRGSSVMGTLEVIEDLPELRDVKVALRVDGTVAAVRREPDGIALPFTQSDGGVRFTIDRVQGHTLVVVERAATP